MSQNRFDLERLRHGIKPLRLLWFPRLRSTNDHAAALRARNALYAPAVVLAGAQTAGRGRGAHQWWSGAGCIAVTLVLAAQEDLALHQLPLIAGLGVRDAISELTDEPRISLKWPNDVVFRGRKLAGLLCERMGGVDLIGLGLNVNAGEAVPAKLRGLIAFLSQVTSGPMDKTDALIAVLRRLHPLLSRPHERAFAGVLREYDRHHCLRGRRISVWANRDTKPIRGICKGLDGMGRLLVTQRGTRHRIVAGHVQVG